MGNYNSQYESYYKTIVNTRNHSGNTGYKKDPGNKIKGNYIIKKSIQNLCGVFVMLSMVIICKVVTIPETQAIYTYSKEIVNTDFDYEKVIDKVRNIDSGESLQEKAIEFIDKVKTKVTGGETIKDKIREKFVLPAGGNIEEENEGIKIETTDKGQVTASYDGLIKECGFDRKLGNYVVIDHGEGIETMYSNLDKVLVREMDSVTKGEQIAINTTEGRNDYINFKILFMGQDNGLEKIIGKNNK